MGRRKHEGSLRGRDGESQRVIDGARRDLIVARQPHKNRKPGGVSGSPRIRPLFVDGHIPDGRRIGLPASVFLQIGFIQFVKPASVFFQHEHVAITVARLGITFDQGVRGYGHWPWIALVGVETINDGDLRLRPRHDLVRDAD